LKNLTVVITRLEQHIQHIVQQGGVGGLAFAITDRERLLSGGAAGFADMAAQRPVTTETHFEICSITKSFTALAIMQLCEQGIIDIHLPITTYLPWCTLKGGGTSSITPYHLLSHSANIIAGPGWTLGSPYAAWYLRETEALAKPGGTFWRYSDTGYEILGALLETIYQRPFSAIIQKQIFEPLGMTSSFPAITYETRKTTALGYQSFYDDRPYYSGYPLVPAYWFEYESPAGSIVSTAADMATYLRMYLNHGRGDTSRLLKEQTFEQMIQPLVQGMFGHYGLGLSTTTRDGHLIVGHGGGMMGFNTTIQGDLDSGIGFVLLMTGTTWPSSIAGYAMQLLRAASEDASLPDVPAPTDPEKTSDASEYAGLFTHAENAKPALLFTAEGERLVLHYQGKKVTLQQKWGDQFLIPHPHFSRFLGEFLRVDGKAPEFVHGSDWYITAAYQGPLTFDHPKEWEAYAGHYFCTDVWSGHIRIVLRKGHLYLVNLEGFEDELQPQEDGSFTTGQDHLRFHDILDGHALRLSMNGAEYTRRRNP
jgi:D-alanyl-D-alanine carboxypeptidase